MINLKKHKTIDALLWSFLTQYGQKAIQVLLALYITRLLSPRDFGTIGMLAVFMELSGSVIDSGFSQALIQRERTTIIEESSVFFLNIFVSVFCVALFIISAPIIANFYHNQSLLIIARVLPVCLLIDSLGLVHRAMLTKAIDFRRLFIINIITAMLSSGIALVMALSGFGVWALVIQMIAGSAFGCIALWLTSNWRPKLVFSLKALRPIFAFGSNLLIAGLFSTLIMNFNELIIGRVFSADSLGFYLKAKSFQRLSLHYIVNSINRVTFPIFSSMQSDIVVLKGNVEKFLTTVGFVIFPITIVLFFIADKLIIFALTDKWAPCIIYFKLLMMMNLFWPFQIISLNVIKSMGHSGLFLRLEVLTKLLFLLSILICYRYGIPAMLIGQVLQTLFSGVVNSIYSGKIINYPFFEQLRDVAPYFIISILLGGIIQSSQIVIKNAQFISVIFSVSFAFIFYIFCCHIFKLKAYVSIMGLIRNRL